ncbi:hypothetical protein SPURM210S_06807 [Streptomyces purpurascens]
MRRLGLAALTTAALCLGVGTAVAGGIGSNGAQKPNTSGDSSGRLLQSHVSFSVKGRAPSKDGGHRVHCRGLGTTGLLVRALLEGQGLQDLRRGRLSAGGAPKGIADDKARYKGGHPYEDFNVDKNDKGMWWVAVTNPKMKDDPRRRRLQAQALLGGQR